MVGGMNLWICGVVDFVDLWLFCDFPVLCYAILFYSILSRPSDSPPLLYSLVLFCFVLFERADGLMGRWVGSTFSFGPSLPFFLMCVREGRGVEVNKRVSLVVLGRKEE